MKKTCADCPHLRFRQSPQSNFAHAACTQINGPVPQNSVPKQIPSAAFPEGDPNILCESWTVTFWRISRHCPLPNHIVEKSERVQPVKNWQVRIYHRDPRYYPTSVEAR